MHSKIIRIGIFVFFLILQFTYQPIGSANGPEISFLEIEKVHNSGITGKGYSVAIIDDGLDTSHPYFTNADILGVNINSDGSATVGPEGAHKFGFHGPGAAGLVVGQKSSFTNTVQVFGDPVFGGWAPGAKLIFITFDQYGDQRLGQERALDWVTNNHKKYNIVAVSLAAWSYLSREWLPPCGEKLFPSVWEKSVNNLLATPVALVVSAGNEARVTPYSSLYPGCMEKAISVSAYQDPNINSPVNFTSLDPAATSIIGPCCYVSAAANSKTNWENYGGTSSSAPIIASIFALANEARPGITREEVIKTMRETARRTTEFGYEYPILNIKAFFSRLAANTPIDISGNLKGAFNYVSSSSIYSDQVTLTPTLTVTATPTPTSRVSSTEIPNSVANKNEIVSNLKLQIKLLNAKLKKICEFKPKPKGC